MTATQAAVQQVREWLGDHPVLGQVVLVIALVSAAALLAVLIRFLVLPPLKRAIKATRFDWDDAFVGSRLLRWLSLIPSGMAVYYGVALFKDALQPGVTTVAQNVAAGFLIFAMMRSVCALLDGFNVVYSRRPDAYRRPIKGYVQVSKIFIYAAGAILIIAALFDQDPWLLLSGLGAMTAVLLLIFKDTILSLVASVQLSNSDMVRVGDWIEMPQLRADGDVVDIALHTVKVQNWDKTITTIPTYKLISESYKNWRGMQESGGRRIKRSINLDMATVRFLSDEDIERFSKFVLLQDYVVAKKKALAAAQAAHPAELVVNRRRLTNLGTFRAYVEAYLRSRDDIHSDMTFLVRQLQPTAFGLPLEIYIFTKTTNWNEFEAIQADIFDHILATIGEFGLAVYQRPAGHDVARAGVAGGSAMAAGAE